MKTFNSNELFPKGEKIISDNFLGDVWLSNLITEADIYNCVIGYVTFEPKARNNWHIHPGGQILLVTEGKGYFQEEGKPVQVIKKGDTIKIKPNVKHWHGASHDSFMAHIAISTRIDAGTVLWLEPVSDEEYNSIKIE